MSLKPGDTLDLQFTTRAPTTGAATAADSAPTATLVHNGVDDGGVSLAVTNPSGAIYKVAGTIPASGYGKGDVVQVRVSATVGGVSDKALIATFVLDSKRVGDLNDLAAGTQMDLVGAPNSTAVAALQSGLATAAEITSLQSHGDGAWATATGFALAASAPGWYAAPDNSDIASLMASVGSSLGTDVGSILTIVGTSGVIVATNNDKSGYALASTGLDAISTAEPSGSASEWNFRQRLLALFGRFFNRATAPDSGNGTLTVYQRDGATTMGALAVSDDGATQTQGGA